MRTAFVGLRKSGQIAQNETAIALMLEAFQMLDIPIEWASAKPNIRRFEPIILVIFVGGACVAILLPFLSLITCAAILAYVSWPLYRLVRRPFGRFQSAAAICMTLLLTCAVILPALWLSVLVSNELIVAYRSLLTYLAETPKIFPRFILSIPCVAGIGYEILGVRDSVLLGVMTGVLSIVPIIGTAVIWGPSGGYFLISGHIWKGILLLLWGILLGHPTEKILRPLLISNVTHVPFLVVLFGVIGGVAACGPVGIFVGPVILAVGLAILHNYTGRTS